MLHNFYFETGDQVRIRHFAEAPVMIVKYKVDRLDPVPDTVATPDAQPGAPVLAPDPTRALYPKAILKPVGVLCFWFLPNGQYQESPFAFKDLAVVARARKVVSV